MMTVHVRCDLILLASKKLVYSVRFLMSFSFLVGEALLGDLNASLVVGLGLCLSNQGQWSG